MTYAPFSYFKGDMILNFSTHIQDSTNSFTRAKLLLRAESFLYYLEALRVRM